MSWRYGVILISRDWIRCLAPLFLERLGQLPQILPKISRCPHLPTCRNQTAQHMKTENILTKGIITLHFTEKYSSLRLPIFEEPWRTRWGMEQTTSLWVIRKPRKFSQLKISRHASVYILKMTPHR